MHVDGVAKLDTLSNTAGGGEKRELCFVTDLVTARELNAAIFCKSWIRLIKGGMLLVEAAGVEPLNSLFSNMAI
jgi:hypothetical protein